MHALRSVPRLVPSSLASHLLGSQRKRAGVITMRGACNCPFASHDDMLRWFSLSVSAPRLPCCPQSMRSALEWEDQQPFMLRHTICMPLIRDKCGMRSPSTAEPRSRSAVGSSKRADGDEWRRTEHVCGGRRPGDGPVRREVEVSPAGVRRHRELALRGHRRLVTAIAPTLRWTL